MISLPLHLGLLKILSLTRHLCFALVTNAKHLNYLLYNFLRFFYLARNMEMICSFFFFFFNNLKPNLIPFWLPRISGREATVYKTQLITVILAKILPFLRPYKLHSGNYKLKTIVLGCFQPFKVNKWWETRWSNLDCIYLSEGEFKSVCVTATRDYRTPIYVLNSDWTSTGAYLSIQWT